MHSAEGCSLLARLRRRQAAEYFILNVRMRVNLQSTIVVFFPCFPLCICALEACGSRTSDSLSLIILLFVLPWVQHSEAN